MRHTATADTLHKCNIYIIVITNKIWQIINIDALIKKFFIIPPFKVDQLILRFRSLVL